LAPSSHISLPLLGVPTIVLWVGVAGISVTYAFVAVASAGVGANGFEQRIAPRLCMGLGIGEAIIVLQTWRGTAIEFRPFIDKAVLIQTPVRRSLSGYPESKRHGEQS
jgi:hypothetical protein